MSNYCNECVHRMEANEQDLCEKCSKLQLETLELCNKVADSKGRIIHEEWFPPEPKISGSGSLSSFVWATYNLAKKKEKYYYFYMNLKLYSCNYTLIKNIVDKDYSELAIEICDDIISDLNYEDLDEDGVEFRFDIETFKSMIKHFIQK